MRKKVLIIGASGSLGQELMKSLSQEYNVSGTYLGKHFSGLIQLDIVNENRTKEVIKEENPEIVIITAAKTNVQDCELNPLDSFRVNVKGIENIVKNCGGKKIIFYSTEGVFDGTKNLYFETDEPNPINVYGKNKLQAEFLVQKVPESLIIRTSRHYGMGGSGKYLNNILALLKEAKEIKAPIKSEGNFTFIPDLISASLGLIKDNREGIYNVVGQGAYSLYDAAIKVAEIFNFNKFLIHPVDKDYFNKLVQRPSCPLSIDKISQEGIKMRSLEEGLNEIKYLENGKKGI